MMVEPGLFITVDGPGGSGKSTLVAKMVETLQSKGVSAVATREPTASLIGEIARNHNTTFRGTSLACLVAADRYDHLAHVRANRALGQIVVSDRYVPSSLVLQSIDGVPVEFVLALNSMVDVPDLSVILHADAATCAQRIRARGVHSRFSVDAETSLVECQKYREVVPILRQMNWPVMEVEISTLGANEIVRRLFIELASRFDLSFER